MFPDDAGFCPADGNAAGSRQLGIPVATLLDDDPLDMAACDSAVDAVRFGVAWPTAACRPILSDGAIDKQTDSRVAVKVLRDPCRPRAT